MRRKHLLEPTISLMIVDI